jgi:putative aldouronate transport system permease protein
LIVALYPLYFIVIASFSDPNFVHGGSVWLFPRGFTLEGYKSILEFNEIWVGYKNSLIYAVVGTAINLVLTIPAGYALSRKDLKGRNAVMLFFTITMFFSGGLIPKFLVVKNLGLYNKFWVMVLVRAASAYNIILCRTFFSSTIPMELWEAASIDGCKNTNFFIKIVIPLSSAIIAVMALFYSVEHWNSYRTALIYLTDKSLLPLQIILRDILIINTVDVELTEVQQNVKRMDELIKYTSIIAASFPVMAMYPFVQKYFVKGVMIGSLKG